MDDELKLPSDKEIMDSDEEEDDFRIPDDDVAIEGEEDPFTMGFHEEGTEPETDF